MPTRGAYEVLELLELDMRDQLVFLHDLVEPGAQVSVVCQHTGLSKDVVAASRNRLLQHGLLRTTSTGEVSAACTPPTEFAQRLHDELNAEYARKRDQLATFHNQMITLMIDRMFASDACAEPGLHVQRLPNKMSVVLKLIELMSSVRYDVMMAEPDLDRMNPADLEGFQAATLRAVHRGVLVRVICPAGQLAHPSVLRHTEVIVGAGAQVRSLADPQPHVIVFDRSIALVLDEDGVGHTDAIIMRERSLVRTVGALFESWWAHARDVGELFVEGAEEVTAAERIMLGLLGDGLKDAAVAKRMGVSVRTVRRRTSDLLERLSADNRFQAGGLAVRRGWI